MTAAAPAGPRVDREGVAEEDVKSSRRQRRKDKRARKRAVKVERASAKVRPRKKPGPRPAAPVSWRGAPFAGLVVALLALGSVSLLVINNSLAAGSFEQSRLRADQVLLFEQEQALSQEVLQLSSPTRLRSQAKALGMLLATPAFVDLDTGRIIGTPTREGVVVAPPPKKAAEDESGDTPPVGDGASDQATLDDEIPFPAPATGPSLDPVAPPVSDPNLATGDGASLSTGTAYDRAVVSGTDVSGTMP